MIARWIVRLVSYPVMLFWYAAGWRVQGQMPDIDKYVFVFAPHTSNWDYVHMIPLALYFRRKPSTMVKHTAFKGPFGWFVRAIGGIPVDRTQSTQVVEQIAEHIHREKRIVIVIAPEGTRRKTDHWKSGFYYIAQQANVPIVLGYLDYRRKIGGAGPTIYPTGDIEGDIAQIRAFYAEHGYGLYPEKASEIRLKTRSAEEQSPSS